MTRRPLLFRTDRGTTSKRADIIRCLVEGNSIRSTVRITGAAKNTVTKLLVDRIFAALADLSPACYIKERETF